MNRDSNLLMKYFIIGFLTGYVSLAIEAKKQYVIHDKIEYSAFKHFKDLILLGVHPQILVSILERSCISNSNQPMQKKSAVASVGGGGGGDEVCVYEQRDGEDSTYIPEDDLPF